MPEPVHPPVNPYRVTPIERDGATGFQITLDTNRPDNPSEPIFGMSDTGKNKAWLDYITLRLNRAFVNGWYGAQGYSSYPEDGYYTDADALWAKITAKTP